MGIVQRKNENGDGGRQRGLSVVSQKHCLNDYQMGGFERPTSASLTEVKVQLHFNLNIYISLIKKKKKKRGTCFSGIYFYSLCGRGWNFFKKNDKKMLTVIQIKFVPIEWIINIKSSFLPCHFQWIGFKFLYLKKLIQFITFEFKNCTIG